MKWLRFPRVLGVVVVAYFAVVAGYFAYETVRSGQFIDDARSVNGVVVALEPRPIAGASRVRPDGTNLPLAPQVRYVVGGRPYLYTASHGVVGSTIRVGDAIEVLYDPANPERARLRGEGRILLPAITAGFGTAAVVLTVVLVLTRNRGTGARSAPTGHSRRTPDERADAADEPRSPASSG